jgi:hypothetical protein
MVYSYHLSNPYGIFILMVYSYLYDSYAVVIIEYSYAVDFIHNYSMITHGIFLQNAKTRQTPGSLSLRP